LFERSLKGNALFASYAFRRGRMTRGEKNVYDHVVSAFECPMDARVWVNTPPEICLERIKGRGRREDEKVSLEMLREVHVLHQEMFA
jgi:predicted kinase